MSYKKVMKSLKTDLMKGSRQSKMKFNPKTDIPDGDRANVEDWTGGYGANDRNRIKEMHPVAKQRAMDKLHALTDSKKHPQTGERMFLLHRGMQQEEYDSHFDTAKPHPNDLGSWTADYKVARNFASDYTDEKKDRTPKIVSAWIPESQIHHIPNAIGSKARDVDDIGWHPDDNPGKAHRYSEHEVIVKPHKMLRHYANKPSEDKKKEMHRNITEGKGSYERWAESNKQLKLKSKLAASEQDVLFKSIFDPKHFKEDIKISHRPFNYEGNDFHPGNHDFIVEAHDKKVMKSLKTDLMKGSFQRRNKFNPRKDISEQQKDHINDWQEDTNYLDKQKIERLEGGGRARALNKLHSLTQARKNPETGEREFLLHRGMDHQTADQLENKTHPIFQKPDYRLSWTPHERVANSFGSSYHSQRSGEEGRTVSAWIPESKIHHILPQIGNVAYGNDKNEFHKEHEVMVDGHGYNIEKDPNVYEKPKLDKITRRTPKGGGADIKSQYMVEKLAASEQDVIKTIKNDLNKALWDKKYPFGTKGTILKPDPSDIEDGVSFLYNMMDDNWDEVLDHARKNGKLKNVPLEETREYHSHGVSTKDEMPLNVRSDDTQQYKDRTVRQAKLKPIIVFNSGKHKSVVDGQHRFNQHHIDGSSHIPIYEVDVSHNPEWASKVPTQGQPHIKSKENQINKPNVKLNPEHGKMIADAYEQMPHNPSHPEVQKAYGALINETKNQFKDMMKSGLKLSRIQPGQENPYKNSKELHADIKNNNHLHFFPTDQGFGSDDSDKSDHPMMQGTGIIHDGKELLANDLFRVVHDYYGHHKGGESGFGPKGEHKAYNAHKKMFSPLAQKALFTETAAQNNWVNWSSKYGEHNRKNPHETVYAEQKAGLMPDHIINRNWHTEEDE